MQGSLHCHPRRRTGGARAPGQRSRICGKIHGIRLLGASGLISTTGSEEASSRIVPPPQAALQLVLLMGNQPCHVDAVGRKAGVSVCLALGSGSLPCDSHSRAGKQAAGFLHSSREGSLRTWPPAGAESWLWFELMLLRRSQCVPLGLFRRLQISFKPIYPGEREREGKGEGEGGTNSAL